MIELSEELGSRLVHLRNLEEGWFDDYGKGSPIESDILVSTLALIVSTKDFLPEPFLCPLVEGGVSLEWHDSLPCSPVIDIYRDRYVFLYWLNGSLRTLNFWLHQVEYLIIALANTVNYK